MFSWFKAKPPEPRWTISVDGYGIYWVKERFDDFFFSQMIPSWNKGFATLQAAEEAIAKYEIVREKSRRKTVKDI